MLSEENIVVKKITIPSVIKWTGSKRSQASSILKFTPPTYATYFEPFLGGGAMMYLLSKPGAVGSDIYQPLVDLWLLIRDKPHDLLADYTYKWNALNAELDSFEISHMSRGNGIPKFYYSIRERFNFAPNALDLNFLLRTCVNGIVRFNDKGEFNNSFHLSRRGMHPENFSKAIFLWHKKIQKVNFYCKDYVEILETTRKNDFVYLDPPYAATKSRYIKTVSPNEIFSQLEMLNRKGVKWAFSYDGKRGGLDLSQDVPSELFKHVYWLHSGNSAVKKVLSGPVEKVEEALYTNY